MYITGSLGICRISPKLLAFTSNEVTYLIYDTWTLQPQSAR